METSGINDVLLLLHSIEIQATSIISNNHIP